MKDEPYDIDEHLHRYAVWCAAKAVQVRVKNNSKIKRTTKNISDAIEESGLRTYTQKNKPKLDQKKFDKEHTDLSTISKS